MPARGLLLDEITDELYAHAARLKDDKLDVTTHRLAKYSRAIRRSVTLVRRGDDSTYAEQQQQRTKAEGQWAAARYKEDE